MYHKQCFHKVTVEPWKTGWHEKKSKIKICECGVKFIEIKDEINIGYKREKCPFCLPYYCVSKKSVDIYNHEMAR